MSSTAGKKGPDVVIRDFMRRAGIDLVRYPYSSDPAKRWVQMFGHHGIDLVLDVGANDGGFAGDIRAFGYTGRIVSFEPLAEAFAGLCRRAAVDEKWSGVQAALGARREALDINVAA